jgi:acetate kinase
MSQKPVLVINCGSSSIKFAVIELERQQTLVTGLAERLHAPDARLVIQTPVSGETPGSKHTIELPGGNHETAVREILERLDHYGVQPEGLLGIGHRVVHGGEHFRSSTLLDAQILEQINTCSKLAPLHNPANIEGIEITRKLFPNLDQVAVFDTAFHQSLPEHAYLYALPYALYETQGIRRYGFHGTSHRFVAEQAAEQLGKPLHACQLITAHLGNGCSATAIRNGKSVDTTMGLTPLEGLVMGTRSGDLDPGIVFHLADSCGYSLNDLNKLLNRESGLLGISGLSNDMRTLQEAAEQGHSRAKLAIDIFCYRLAKAIAGLTVALERVDALVFTGGIGENSAVVRSRVLQQLGALGYQLDAEANAGHGRVHNGRITQAASTLALVIPTNEELMIAQDTATLILDKRGNPRG